MVATCKLLFQLLWCRHKPDREREAAAASAADGFEAHIMRSDSVCRLCVQYVVIYAACCALKVLRVHETTGEWPVKCVYDVCGFFSGTLVFGMKLIVHTVRVNVSEGFFFNL